MVAFVGSPSSPPLIPGVPAPSTSAAARWRLRLVLLVVGWHCLFLASPTLRNSLGFSGDGGTYPDFIDSLAVLAAAETHHLGGDAFQRMALDPFHRKHSYSSWWFALGDWGLTRADNSWFGALIVLAFAVAVLARLRVRAAGEFWWLLGTAGSAPLLLATTRANNDLVVFALLAPLAPCLLHPSRLVRLVAPFLVALAAGLKYYPLVAGVLLFAEPDPRDRGFRLGVLALLLLTVGLSVAADLRHFADTQPTVFGYLGFGAGFGLDVLGVPSAWQGRVGLLFGLGCGLAAFFTRGWQGWLRRMAGEEQWLQFVLGAALLAGCFWAGMSWAYRWVFALWLAPFLWRPVEAGPMPVAARRWWRAARTAYWPALWGGTAYFLICELLQAAGHAPSWRFNLAVWALVQAACWLLCGALTVFVGAFAWDGVRGLAQALWVPTPDRPSPAPAPLPLAGPV